MWERRTASVETQPQRSAPTWMVRRSKIDEFVTTWLQGHGLSVGSEALGRF